MAKKVAVARMMTSNLMRQYGDRPGAEAVIEAEVRGAVLDTTARVTPDRVHEMESRIRAKLGVPGPGSGGSTGRLSGGAGRGGSAPSTGGTTKSLTAAGRSLAKHHPGSAGVSPAGESPDAWFASGGGEGKSSGRGSRDEGSGRRALDFGADSLMMTSPAGGRMLAGGDTFGRSVSSPALRAGGSPAIVSGTASRAAAPGGGAASRFDRDATSSGPASPAVLESLSTLKSYVAADPEPEKVLGLVDEVRAELQAKRERAAAQAKAAAIRADHAADEAAKAERKALEHGVEQMWKKVTEATVGEMASREEAERAAARARHAEEGRVRAAQVAASHTSKTREKAEQLAWEKFQLKLSLEQEAREAREASAAAATSKAATRASLEENAVLQAAKREAEERRRAEDLRAMMEYSAFVEAQERARKEALAATYARINVLGSQSDDRKKAEIEAEAERKALERQQFEDARAKIAAAEAADRSARKRSAATIREGLRAQAEERRRRSDAETGREKALQATLRARAEEAAAEAAAARRVDVAHRAAYRSLLEQQMAAKSRLSSFKKERERGAVLEALDELAGENDPVLLAKVGARLEERAARDREVAAAAAAQREAFAATLAEMGVDPAASARMGGR